MDWITDQIAIGDYREAQNRELLEQSKIVSILETWLGSIGPSTRSFNSSNEIRRCWSIAVPDGVVRPLSWLGI